MVYDVGFDAAIRAADWSICGFESGCSGVLGRGGVGNGGVHGGFRVIGFVSIINQSPLEWPTFGLGRSGSGFQASDDPLTAHMRLHRHLQQNPSHNTTPCESYMEKEGMGYSRYQQSPSRSARSSRRERYMEKESMAYGRYVQNPSDYARSSRSESYVDKDGMTYVGYVED